jgi:hypothetical protein
MKRWLGFLFILFSMVVIAKAAQIIPTPLPFVFLNGTTADATQVNSDLNTIVNNVNNNYVTGTFTPTIGTTNGGAGTPSFTYSVQNGSYESWGRTTHLRGTVAWTASSCAGCSGFSFSIIQGLPTTPSSTDNAACTIVNASGWTSMSFISGGLTSVTPTGILLYDEVGPTNLQNNKLQASGNVNFSCTYHT